MNKQINALEHFFTQRGESVSPKDYGFSIVINGYGEVTKVCGNYLELSSDDALYFEDLTDSELFELEQLKETIEADDYKTEKRISN